MSLVVLSHVILIVLTIIIQSCCNSLSIREKKVFHNDTVVSVDHKFSRRSGVLLSKLNGTLVDILEDQEESFDTDSMDWEFDEKARKDGYKLTTPEQNPYAVMLWMKANMPPIAVCSGTLLSLNWVLSAAHCVTGEIKGLSKVQVLAGGTASDLLDIKSCKYCQIRIVPADYTYPYPEYKDKDVFRDLSLVYVEIKFVKTAGVQAIGLSRSHWSITDYEACRLTGFGLVQMDEVNLDDNERKTSYLEVKSPCDCPKWRSTDNREYTMCNKPREDYGLCSGDSGGGLLCQDRTVVGIASSILTYTDVDTCDHPIKGIEHPCGLKNTVSIFVQTYPYVEWIDKYLKGGKPKPRSNKSLGKRSSWFILVVLFSTLIIIS